MHALVACARSSALACALVLASFGISPVTLLAQTTSPTPEPEALVARCDMPVVDLYNPMPGDVLEPGSYMISGLALDPMADDTSSGIDLVSFFLGDRDQGGVSLGTVVPSGGARQADFTLSVTLPSLDPGTTSELEAFAHSSLSGKQTELSLPVMLGPNPSPSTPVADPTNDVVNTNPGVLPETCSTPDAPPPVLATPSPVTTTAAPNVSVPVAKPKTTTSTAPLFGEITGTVSICRGGTEQPISMATIQVQGTSAAGSSDPDGVFAVMRVPAPGTYTVSVSEGGQTATRMYVPVMPGEIIDIGTLVVGADVIAGCGEGLPPTT
jgi:hypothetical protein